MVEMTATSSFFQKTLNSHIFSKKYPILFDAHYQGVQTQMPIPVQIEQRLIGWDTTNTGPIDL